MTFASGPTARRSDPATSHQAAFSFTAPELARSQTLVLMALREHASTAGEVTRRLRARGHEVERNCVARRITDLQRQGLVADTTCTRVEATHRRAIVWGLTDAGREQAVRLAA